MSKPFYTNVMTNFVIEMFIPFNTQISHPKNINPSIQTCQTISNAHISTTDTCSRRYFFKSEKIIQKPWKSMKFHPRFHLQKKVGTNSLLFAAGFGLFYFKMDNFCTLLVKNCLIERLTRLTSSCLTLNLNTVSQAYKTC